jgi:hypothetical protein
MENVLKKALLLLLLLTFALGSCGRDVFAEHCEIGIRLPEDFEKIDTDAAFDLAHSDGELVVGITRLSFDAVYESGIPATVSVREFAELYQVSSGMKQIIYDFGDTVYYSYEIEKNGVIYEYIPTFWRTPYAYFIITFITHGASEWSADEALKLTEGVYLINE